VVSHCNDNITNHLVTKTTMFNASLMIILSTSKSTNIDFISVVYQLLKCWWSQEIDCLKA